MNLSVFKFSYFTKLTSKPDDKPHLLTNNKKTILTISTTVSGNLECWIEHNKMEFDEKTGEYSNIEGVEVRVPGWGQVETLEYLDPSITAYVLGNVGSYFAPLIHSK